jgi:hypothetical protein
MIGCHIAWSAVDAHGGSGWLGQRRMGGWCAHLMSSEEAENSIAATAHFDHVAGWGRS